jgi:hypothetical protein
MRVARGVMKKRGLVTVIFHSTEGAENAYQDLVHRGYEPSDIMVIMSQENYRSHFLGRVNPLSNNGEISLAQYISRPGAAVEVPGIGLVVSGPFATNPSLRDQNENAREMLIAAGLEGDRAIIYEPKLHAGGILIGVLPKGPTDRYTIGHGWRKSEGELILGDDEDF